MATAEAETSGDERSPPGGLVYDGFISYSHAADDLLAPRLQAGLQRFAKPWWKRRALRMFRDESSLSANPHLWSSITDALDQSGWFVLLLSPDAAKSPWVNNEVKYWLEHKDPDRIIPVLTDGNFDWADGDVTGDAAPPALVGAFSNEPRWVDLRFARTEKQLDLKNPRFSAAVADVASAIRGIPKDELESEEVRQHRRTTRTAWGAGAALLALALIAGGAAIFALDQQADAVEAAQQAQAEALAANSLSVREVDPELAVLLALESLELRVSPTGQSALHQALQAHRTLATFPAELRPSGGLVAATLGPDAQRIAIVYIDRLEFWDARTYEQLSSTVLVADTEQLALVGFTAPSFTNNGNQLVLAISGPRGATEPSESTGVLVVDAATAETVAFHPLKCIVGVQPTGGRFVDRSKPLVVESSWASSASCGETTRVASLLDLDTGDVTEVATVICCGDGVATSSSDASRVAVGGVVVDVASGETIYEFDPFDVSTLSADGTEILVGFNPLERRSVDTGELLQSYQGVFSQVWFSADGSKVYGTARQTGSIMIFDTDSGSLVLELRGHQGRPSDAVLSRDGQTLVSSAFQDGPRLWDLTPARGDAASIDVGLAEGANLGQYLAGVRLAGDLLFVNAWDHPMRWDAPSRYVLFDLGVGRAIRESKVWASTMAPDGSWIVEQPIIAEGITSPSGREGSVHVGQVRVVDAVTGAVLRTMESCDWYWHVDELAPEPGAGCDLEAVDRYGDIEVSADGSVILAATWDANERAWDALTGATIMRSDRLFGDDFTNPYPIASGLSPDGSTAARFNFPPMEILEHNLAEGSTRRLGLLEPAHEVIFNAAGSQVFLADLQADLTVIDVATWTEVARMRGGQGGSLRDVDLNSDETRAATAGFDKFVRVWDLATESLVIEIEVDADLPQGLTDVEFLNDTTLIVAATDSSYVLVFTLDPDELIDIAVRRITRGLTDQECATYGIDPCRTLDELRAS